MTALDQYQRLEAVALWCPAPGQEPREVVLSFGNATLTLMDMNEAPRAHWSLAALEEIGSDEYGLVLTPDPDHAETLSLDDPQMIAAIRAVRRTAQDSVIEQRRIGLAIPALIAVVLLVMGVIFARGPITTYVTAQVDELTWERVGVTLARDRMERADARFCRVIGVSALRTTRGHPLLIQMTGRLAPSSAAIRPLLVHFDGPAMISFPGTLVLVNAAIVNDASQPEQIAGLLALAQARHDLDMDNAVIAQTLGLIGTLRLAFSGSLPEGQHQALLNALQESTRLDPAADATALRMLTAAQLPSLPVSLLLNDQDVPRLRIEALQAGDSIGTSIYTPALDDADWLRLTSACP